MRGVAAACAGFAGAVAAACLLGGAGLGRSQAAVALAIGAAVAAATWVASPRSESRRPGAWDLALLGVYALVSFRAFFWLVYPSGDEWRVLSPHNLGDLSLHIGLIRYFASGIAFWPPSPILAGAPLTYPPGSDLFNALLLLSGWDWRAGLVAVGFGVSMLGGWALWRYGGAFAVAALLFGGGLAGFAILRTGEFVEYGSEGVWKNVFLTMVVPQRGFLFALPAGLVLLAAWRSEFFGGPRVVPWLAQVLIYATLPLFQLHTFLFLSCALAATLAFRPSSWRKPVSLVAAAAVPATAAVLAVTGWFSAGGRMRLDPAWVIAQSGPWGFALEFGIAIPLGLALIWQLRSCRDRSAWWLTAVSGALALAAFCFPLTDWAWDNTKLLVWSWLAVSPLLWQHVLKPLPLASRAAICTLLFFSGAIGLAAGLDLRHGYRLANRTELADWEVRTASLPPETVFAIPPDYNHPILLLGRRAVCGYEGHLSSHGLDYTGTLEKLRRLLAKEPGWESLAHELGASFVAVRAWESPTGKPRLIEMPKPPALPEPNDAEPD